MTLKQMAKECKKIWIEALRSEDKLKPDWAFKKYKSGCPACQYVLDTYGEQGTVTGYKCKKCPLIKLWGGSNAGVPCAMGKNSPYKLYEDGHSDHGYGVYPKTNRTIAAIRIIDYLEKEFGV